MRTTAARLTAAAAIAATAGVLAAGSPAPAATSSGWAPAGAIAVRNSPSVVFAGPGIAISPAGAGMIAWEDLPNGPGDLLATFSAAAAPRRIALAYPFKGAVTGLVPVRAGGFALGTVAQVALPGETTTVAFQLAFGTDGPSFTPGLRQRLESYPAVMAAAGAGVAVLGASGAQPVLTICTRGGCGRTVALAPSTGTLSTSGGEAQGTGLAVAGSSSAEVLAAWVRNGRVEARLRSPTGQLGPLQELARVHKQVWLAGALSATGAGAIVWESQDKGHRVAPGPTNSPTTAQAALAPAGGRFGAAITLGSFPASPALTGAAAAGLSEPPVVAVDFDGSRALALWTAHGAGGFAVDSGDLDDPAATQQTLSPPDASAYLGALAVAPGSGALATWLACDPSGTCQLQAAQAPAGGAFAPAATVAPGPFEYTYFARGAVGAIDPSSGRAWVAATSPHGVYLFSAPQL